MVKNVTKLMKAERLFLNELVHFFGTLDDSGMDVLTPEGEGMVLESDNIIEVKFPDGTYRMMEEEGLVATALKTMHPTHAIPSSDLLVELVEPDTGQTVVSHIDCFSSVALNSMIVAFTPNLNPVISKDK